MNTGAFQRLRRIRQLALAQLVYPGCLHTRFEHSTGTMHIAGRICDRLIELDLMKKDDAKRIVRIAALLHDIGHGPFSHVSEYLLDRYYDHERLGTVGPREKIHERITVDIILNNQGIADILPEEDRRAVADLIEGSGSRTVQREIVTGSLDADKMDYLLRDSYFAGVEYGRFDLEKIIDVCRVLERGGESYLAFDESGIYALEQLVLAKYHMSQQVYFHRIRAITDAMLVRGISLAIDNEVPEVAQMFRYDGTPEYIERYMQAHDESVLANLSVCGHENASAIISRLLDRRLFKQLCELRVDKVDDTIRRDQLSSLEYGSGEAKRLEAAIAEEISQPPDLVIVAKQSIKNPTFRSPSYRLDEDEILVLDEEAVPRKISEFPDLIFSFNTSAKSQETIRVFAPHDDWNDPGDRRSDERASLQESIRALLLQVA